MNGSPVLKLIKLREVIADPFSDLGLPTQQDRVAKLAAVGIEIDEIAERLDISPVTVYSHLRQIRVKTGMGKADLTRRVFERIEEVLE